MLSDGSPANPPEFSTTELNWRQGDVIPLGRERSLRVLCVRDDDADRPAGYWSWRTCRWATSVAA